MSSVRAFVLTYWWAIVLAFVVGLFFLVRTLYRRRILARSAGKGKLGKTLGRILNPPRRPDHR